MDVYFISITEMQRLVIQIRLQSCKCLLATFSVAALLSVCFQWYIDEGNNLRLPAFLPILRQSIWVRQDYVIMLIYVITGTTMKLRSRITFKKTNQTKVVLSSTVANHLWAVYSAVGQ